MLNRAVFAFTLTLCLCASAHSQIKQSAENGEKATADLEILEEEYGRDDLKLIPTLDRLAEYYGEQGVYQKALQYAQRSLAINEKAFGPEHPVVARSLHNMGGLYKDIGEYSRALPYLRRSLAIREKTLSDDHPDVAWSLNHLADLYRVMGDYQKSLPLFQRSLEIREKAYGADHPEVAASLSNLGELFHNMGEYEKALSYFLRSLAIFNRTLGADAPYEALVLNDLGALYRDMGEYSKALQVHQQSLAIQEKIFGSQHPSVALNLNNLGVLYQDIGEYEKALSLYKRSLDIFENVLGPKHTNVAMALNNLGRLHQRKGEYAKAVPLYERSLAVIEQSLGPEHPYVGRELANIAWVHMEMGNYGKASILLEQSLRIYQKSLSPDHPWIGRSLIALASLNTTAREYAKALPLYRQALQIGIQSKDPELLWRAQDGLRDVLVKSNQPEVAIFFGKQAVNTIQGLRARLTNIDRDLQESFLKDKVGAYRNLADILIDSGRLGEAQQVLAMLKEEEYFDFVRRDAMSDPRTTIVGLTGPERQLQYRFSEIGNRIAEQAMEREDLRRRARVKLTDAEHERLTQLEDNLKIARHSFDEALNELLTEFATSSGRRRVEVGLMNLPSLRSMQGTLQELGHGAVILNYLITNNKLRILLTTPQIQIARESAVTAKELNRKIEAFREVLQNPTRDSMPLAQELYKLLISPVAEDLIQAKAETLMLSLDGTLRYVPFAAVHSGKEYLIERYSIVMFTDAAKDKIKDKSTKQWRLAGLGLTRQIEGFSPLPAVREELNGIVRTSSSPLGVLPGTIQLDADFSEETMQRALDDAYPVLHVASHFVFSPGTDSDSFLLLGDGKKLSLRDIKEENFDFRHVELLTLSACETAVGGGADANGREIEGLGALAQKQGAKAVLATLWSVADQSTGQLMQDFYRLRDQEKITKAEALRRAQLRFLHDAKPNGVVDSTYGLDPVPKKKYAAQGRAPVASYPVDSQRSYVHPFYWAPFVLIGNWL